MEQLSVQTSGGYYPGIGYEQTESVHFEDLKQKQEALKTKTIELVKEFRLLQKMTKTTKGKQVADATSEEAGDKEEEDEDDDLDEGKLELTMRQQNFCETRQELMDSIRGWAKESSNQMAAFPSIRSKARHMKNQRIPLKSVLSERCTDEKWFLTEMISFFAVSVIE